jgi:hypothetical protein
MKATTQHSIPSQQQNIRQQLFQLNNLSTDELKLKWHELFNTVPPNYRKGYLVKEIAYRIQTLMGKSNVSNEEVKTVAKITKKKLNEIRKKESKQVVILPPPGSTIRTFYKGNEYIVKVIDENKFDYMGKIYKSLSAIATDIAGTRWSGYAFFKLKRKITK